MGLDMYLMRVDKDTDVSQMDSFWDVAEEVAYWRKANQVHKWFVDHVQDGIDDCQLHNEVSLDLIRELRYLCARIIDETRLVKGKVVSHYSMIDGRYTPHYRDGKVIDNVAVCQELLPRQTGFFFGGEGYDESYMHDIVHTFKTCSTLLEEINPEEDSLYYYSSW